MTTRRTPAEMISSAQVRGLDARAAHGSSELYKVAPASRELRWPASSRPRAEPGRLAAGRRGAGQRDLLGVVARIPLTGEAGRDDIAVRGNQDRADGEGGR